MLIRERLEEGEFSNSEQAVVEFILQEKLAIREIAKRTFTSPSALLRVARKMNFDGWNELKEAFLKEEEYLATHFHDLDANFPFRRGDPVMTIAGKIASIKKEAIDDTCALLHHGDLQRAVQMLRNVDTIGVYAGGNNLIIAREFQRNMVRIGKKVEMSEMYGEMDYMAYAAKNPSCAIVISYSGETPVLVQAAQTLKKHKIPLIVITNIGDSRLARLGDHVLRICTREKQYSKIGTFTMDSSTAYLLDVLYSCLFALDYDKNLQFKIAASRSIEGKKTALEIIWEG